MIASNVIKCSYENKIKNIIFFASNCIYPELCPQPIKEKYLFVYKNNSFYGVINKTDILWYLKKKENNA